MPPSDVLLHDGFERSAERFSERPALAVSGTELSYGELRDRAAGLAATLVAAAGRQRPGRVAIYAYRSPAAFVGVLGALLAGAAYVPLNPTLAAERNRLMLDRAGCPTIIADAASATELATVLAGCEEPITIVIPDLEDAGAIRLPGHRVLGAGDLAPAVEFAAPAIAPSDTAYVLFTSGSTGVPKGVTVTHANVRWLLESMRERYALRARDRVSQTHELTFDVSVWDMFVAWDAGACLCCPSGKELISPGRFIRDAGLTVWFSVPSTAILMKRLGQLKPGAYPGLRHSLFAGEPLPVAVAQAWIAAAPGSTVENLYGPTELTIVCLGYRWSPAHSPSESEAGTVPIGAPLRGNRPLVVDAELHEVAPGEAGELLVSGPQVTTGYWRDEERTRAAFVIPSGCDQIHYRTGDRVRRPTGDAPMTYLGRLDHQVKVRGVRVELGEVEAVLREETGVDAVIAIAWPLTATGADGIVAFVGATEVDRPRVTARLRERLLPQMVPRELRLLDELPLNASGKFDRAALAATLDQARELVA